MKDLSFRWQVLFFVCVVFDKFCYWHGEGDITTFCWSNADLIQLWCELEAKSRHRYDLFACLKDFVDLQKIFGKLISSKVSVSLESAMKLLQMDYKGQIHTDYSDSFNTVRILHKLFCTESLSFEFDYINPNNSNEKNEKIKCKTPEETIIVHLQALCLRNYWLNLDGMGMKN